MNLRKYIQDLLPQATTSNSNPQPQFMPTNIALIKYWGKRDVDLQLPTHSSLSVTLPNWGTTTKAELAAKHQFILNGVEIADDDPKFLRLVAYLELIKPTAEIFYKITSDSQVPIAAGLASSASGFAALVTALDNLHNWHLDKKTLSILARIGSGSACRSFWPGFVVWQAGERADGLDSYGVPLTATWPDLCLGIVTHKSTAKVISSRDAMINCANTSPDFANWVQQAKTDLPNIKKYIATQDFSNFGAIIEANAAAMHDCMASSKPAIVYSDATSKHHLATIKKLRAQGIPIYATQDAGANIKFVCLQQDIAAIQAVFADSKFIRLF